MVLVWRRVFFVSAVRIRRVFDIRVFGDSGDRVDHRRKFYFMADDSQWNESDRIRGVCFTQPFNVILRSIFYGRFRFFFVVSVFCAKRYLVITNREYREIYIWSYTSWSSMRFSLLLSRRLFNRLYKVEIDILEKLFKSFINRTTYFYETICKQRVGYFVNKTGEF